MDIHAASPIGDSELIITPEGTVYHLNLHPDQLAPLVITVGDPARVEMVSQYFDCVEHRTHHREFISHVGKIGSKRIMVISTGMGTNNMDIVINELDALANINFEKRTVKDSYQSLQIVRLGTCGSLNSDVGVDQLVVSTFAIGLDNLMHYYLYEPSAEEQFIQHEFMQHSGLHKTPILPYVAEGAIHLRNLFARPHFHHGITITGPGFYAPQGRNIRAGLRHPNLLNMLSSFGSRQYKVMNFEMETSALYGLGKLLGHQCLSINTVVASRLSNQFSTAVPQSIDKMIQQALTILSAA